jgi:hypothetical protein
MRVTPPASWVLFAAFALACAEGSENQAREWVASALSDSLGKSAEPSVGFLNDRKHLQVSLSAARFAECPDSAFAEQAKQIAKFALARYGDAGGLDSITVLDREPVSDGVWKIRRINTFAVGALRGAR